MRINGAHASLLIQSHLNRSVQRGFSVQRCCNAYRALSHHVRRPVLRSRIPAPNGHLENKRGAKTKTTVKLEDLPQGALKLEPFDDGVDDAPRYPAVVQGHRNNMQKFKNCIILTRVGSFYEVRYLLDLYDR